MRCVKINLLNLISDCCYRSHDSIMSAPVALLIGELV